MTRSTLFAILAAFAAAFLAPTAAYAQDATRMTVRPESKLTLSGGSNLHAWSCSTNAFQATIELDPGFPTNPLTEIARPITKVAVSVPVKSLKCGHDKMNENMYKALKSDEHPDIKYVLKTYDVNGGTTANAFAAVTIGELTVAGTTARVEIPISADKKDGGAARGEGSVHLKMTDFGVKPPTALLGTLRTKNEIEIKFEVLLDRAVIVALTGQ